MKHFVYQMKALDPAPAGPRDRTTESWFNQYKVRGAGETYVPTRQEYAAAESGDTIWFQMDGTILSCAPFLRMQDDGMNGRKELWYDADRMRMAGWAGGSLVADGITVPRELGDLWLKSVREEP